MTVRAKSSFIQSITQSKVPNGMWVFGKPTNAIIGLTGVYIYIKARIPPTPHFSRIPVQVTWVILFNSR